MRIFLSFYHSIIVEKFKVRLVEIQETLTVMKEERLEILSIGLSNSITTLFCLSILRIYASGYHWHSSIFYSSPPTHSKSGSTLHKKFDVAHPSPSERFPSSHSSADCLFPFPHLLLHSDLVPISYMHSYLGSTLHWESHPSPEVGFTGIPK